MTLANDSLNRIADASTSGTPLATHLVDGKEYPVVMVADKSGHIQQTLPTYSWWLPGAVVGTSKLYGDLYNSSASTAVVQIRGVWAIPKTDVAVTSGVLGIEIGLFRTNAIGTTGLLMNYNSTLGTTSHSVTPYDTNNSSAVFATTGISTRAIPAGGATIAALHWVQYVQTEETAVGTYVAAFTNLVPVAPMSQRITLNAGQGLLIKQGAVESTGTMAFMTQFTVL